MVHADIGVQRSSVYSPNIQIVNPVPSFIYPDDTPDDPDNDFKIVTPNDTGGGRNWSDYEVQSLLHIWSDEMISRRLDGTFRNKQVFEEISLRLMEFGINRDWKQCRRKYKNLKYEYHCIQKDENNENQRTMRQTVKFFNQIDHILRHFPKITAQVAENEPCGSVPNQAICLEESRSFSGAQNLSGKYNIYLGCIKEDKPYAASDLQARQ